MWSRAGSNRRPLRCERSALPAELLPRKFAAANFPRRTKNVNKSATNFVHVIRNFSQRLISPSADVLREEKSG